ncbi:class I SAM-dependent methyltransferase [Citreicoccus inhibens]|uniref:class I SAM-dependent methyltransferase n=1 Tax=Citreicoccus inhibens TaxID=2849499 RepID=UPI001F26273D|nr:class I SAM-dependent methyltransferase [Citreicoccus inhibens]
MTEPAARRSSEPHLAPVPDACYLCRGGRLTLRHAARGGAGPDGAAAYNCTSFGHRHHPPIWGCEDCGMLFQWPMRSAQALLQAYQDVEDPLYVAEKDNRYRTFRRVLKELGPADSRSLLDVGAYCGYFLDVAREGGFRPEGLELSRWAAGHARQLGFTVHGVPLQELASRGGTYDVVTLWDVVEHFADPREELAAAFQLVRPGGRVYLSTIDVGSLVARMLGGQWPWLMDMHLFYFARRTLAMLLEEVGFRVTDVRTYTHIISADYLLRKVSASFRPAAPVLELLRRGMPGEWSIPFNLGDNMLMAAERPL